MSGVFKKDIWREENLNRVHDGWDEIEAEETCLLRRMRVEESLDHFIALQHAFEPSCSKLSLFSALNG